MARKPRARTYAASQGGPRTGTSTIQPRRWRKLLIGGVVLVLVVGIGGVVRWLQQREMVAQLHSAGSHRYERGPGGAPVVIKEFSDYT